MPANLDSLIEGIREEDRLLRCLLAECPPRLLDESLDVEALSAKETLGHLAFWDDYAVRFFEAKLDQAAPDPEPPVNFEQRSWDELDRIRRESFADVLRRYEAATTALIQFLRDNWAGLPESSRRDFHVPLKHRRQHRLTLSATFAAAASKTAPQERASEG